ncbi:DUF692 domain-containing protein [Cognaticolwellia aestuarii]|uniref:MNIO family bufferin maturase n=1 Tax=Cognaticolwellia aestuarii TaxID=329993 RepID=UPI00098650F4|nr:DUF692 domain-containing protein [Cognaticolwellia aestuarii]
MSDVVVPEHFLGFGLGLRTEHFQDVLNDKPNIDWFEVVSENFMVDGGKPKHYLHSIRELYPMVMHGVSLSIGSTDPLNFDYLRKLKVLSNELQPEWISDHLCWTGAHEKNSHDLLPLPYNDEALTHVCQRVEQVQDFLGRPILLENVSSYLSYKSSEMTEWQFFNEVARRSGCEILLDINNIYVSARNHHFNPQDYLNGITKDKVKQFHLAGHSDYGDYVIDTHDHPVADPVWQLYQQALIRFGLISTMIERDDNIPPLVDLLAEVDTARKIAQQTLGLSNE